MRKPCVTNPWATGRVQRAGLQLCAPCPHVLEETVQRGFQRSWFRSDREGPFFHGCGCSPSEPVASAVASARQCHQFTMSDMDRDFFFPGGGI